MHVYCKGPFGSESLSFVWNKLLLARLREPVFFCLERLLGSGSQFCLGLNIIVFAVGPLGSGACIGIRSGAFSLWEPVLNPFGPGSRFYCYTA